MGFAASAGERLTADQARAIAAAASGHADLSGRDLSDVDLTGFDLSGADLRGADLSGANFTQANLTFAWIIRANFTDARLNGATMQTIVTATGMDNTAAQAAEIRPGRSVRRVADGTFQL
jgi:Pentapeptide repeats (8 copies)